MDEALANAMKVSAECHDDCQAALLNFAAACRNTDELSYCRAASNVLASWLRSKRMVESAHLKLLTGMVEQSPEDFGGEDFLLAVRRSAAKAEEASLNDFC
jgi:hypothetical protein